MMETESTGFEVKGVLDGGGTTTNTNVTTPTTVTTNGSNTTSETTPTKKAMNVFKNTLISVGETTAKDAMNHFRLEKKEKENAMENTVLLVVEWLREIHEKESDGSSSPLVTMTEEKKSKKSTAMEIVFTYHQDIQPYIKIFLDMVDETLNAILEKIKDEITAKKGFNDEDNEELDFLLKRITATTQNRFKQMEQRWSQLIKRTIFFTASAGDKLGQSVCRIDPSKTGANTHTYAQ
jgi:hypothetical protein